MNELVKVFNNDSLGKVRIALLDNEPMFNLNDVCFDLGYTTKNGRGATYIYKARVESICTSLDIKGVDVVSTNRIKITKDIDFENTWIDEQSFYDLCLESHAKNARPFRKWVTGEVLPSIRKDGAYITDKAKPEMLREKADEIESLSVVNETLKIVMDRIDKLPIAEESKVLVMKGILKKAGLDLPIDVTSEEKYYDGMQIARQIGIYSNSGKPHGAAVNAIFGKIEILESEKKTVWESNGSWQGTVTKYTYSIIDKVKRWLVSNNYPEAISFKTSSGKEKTYRVIYKEVA